MTWIQPFELETFLVNIFSGNPEIFFAISLIAIIGMSAYFRMTQLTMFFMIGVFVVMFQGLNIIPISIYTIIALVASLVVGFAVHKLLSRQ